MLAIRSAVRSLFALVYPPTKAKLHKLVTAAGVVFAVVSIVLTWWGTLGLTTAGKIGATIGTLTTLAAGWKRERPKIEAMIESLPIPEGDKGFALVFALVFAAAAAVMAYGLAGRL